MSRRKSSPEPQGRAWEASLSFEGRQRLYRAVRWLNAHVGGGEALAPILGVRPCAARHVVSGERNLSEPLAQRVAAALKTTVSAIVRGEWGPT